MKTASFDKQNLIKNSDQPEYTEKQYNAFIINKAFSFHDDSVLIANEMNMRPDLFAAAQYQFYIGMLRKRKRFSKWHKTSKDEELDLLQEIYCCNRKVAKQYRRSLTDEQMEMLKRSRDTGGSSK